MVHTLNKEDWSGKTNVDIYQCRQLLRHGCYPRPRQSCNTCKRKVTNKPSYLFQRRTNCWERGYFESINLNILLGREGEVAKSLLNPCNSHLGENLKKMRNHKDQLLPGELLHSEKSQDQFCKPIKQEIRPKTNEVWFVWGGNKKLVFYLFFFSSNLQGSEGLVEP